MRLPDGKAISLPRLGALIRGAMLMAVIAVLPTRAALAAYQPDMLIRNASEATFVGDNVYGVLDDQTKSQTVTTQTAYFVMRLQNDGDLDNFLLHANAGDAYWRIRYFRMVPNGTPEEITTQLNSTAGYLLTGMQHDAFQDFHVSIAPITPDVIPGGSTPTPAMAAVLHAVSQHDTTKGDAARAIARKEIVPQLHLTAQPPSPQPVNTAITLTASLTANVSVQMDYRFRAGIVTPNGWVWRILQDWSASATCVWTPSIGGKYTLTAEARNPATPTVRPLAATLAYLITPRVTLTADPPSPKPVNTPVTLTARVVGAGNTLQYRFLAGPAPSVYPRLVVIRDWGATATCLWTPHIAGIHVLAVEVREVSSSTTAPLAFAAIHYAVTPTVLLTAQPSSPQPVNTHITLTARAAGLEHPEYRFRLGHVSPTTNAWAWIVLRNWSTTATCVWTPIAPAAYVLIADARPAGSSAVTGSSLPLPYRITALKLVADPPSPKPVGTTITLTALNCELPNPEYRFRFEMLATTGTVGHVIRDWSATATCQWVPRLVGQYVLVVDARTASSAAYISARLPYVVTAPPITAVTLTADPASPQPVGTQVTLHAQATGGWVVLYKFRAGYVQDNVWHWEDLTAFTTASTCTWTPTMAATYTLVVIARERNSTQAACASAVLRYQVTSQ